jgi:Arc/MetJ family transcription regulator
MARRQVALELDSQGWWSHPSHSATRALRRNVYDWCIASRSRTNIELDDSAIRTIMDRYRLRTKTEAVDLALKHLAGSPMSLEEALSMRGAHAIGRIPPDQRPSRA